MKSLLNLIVLVVLFSSCEKLDLSPNSSNPPTNNAKVLTPSGLKIADKISGIVICTVDEDILSAAIINYYGAAELKKHELVEMSTDLGETFYVLIGRVKTGNQSTRFAFELHSQLLPSGGEELFLPVAGTEQNLYGPGNGNCKLKITSASTGYASCAASGLVNYSSSTSSVLSDNFGTSKLVAELLILL